MPLRNVNCTATSHNSWDSPRNGSSREGGFGGFCEDADMRDLKTGRVVLASKTTGKANGLTFNPQISANGKYVIMTSRATNLVPGGDANGTTPDVLRRGPLR